MGKYEAVIDLHERGYSEDFQLTGNSLLWLQGKIKMGTGDFYITEYHLFLDSHPLRNRLAIFGVVAFYRELKGILIYHCNKYPYRITSILRKKLDDASMYTQKGKLFTALANN